ncbi:MAG TPA: LytR C-terminal domain-containing protein [Solirubrobacteraceae bacterium]|nr:LytR C-terminal domain-containing protein [Solirubrobacteraceae bacterium]
MTALVAAFSLQDKIEQYGAYAGIAAVFGLGILSLLYFAQAREVKRLRDWAGRAPERAAELEARVQADAQRRAAATQQPRPAAPVTPAAQQGAAAPAAAPGVAAPATAAAAAAGATAVAKPATGAPQNGTGSSTAVPPPVKPGQPGQPQETKPGNGDGKPAEAKPGDGAPGAPAGQPPAPGQPAAKPGTPAQPGTPGAPAQPAAPAAPAAKPPTPAGQPGPVAVPAATAAAAARPAQPAAPLRAETPSASLPPRSPMNAVLGTDSARSKGRIAAIVGGVLGLAAIAAAAVLLFTGGGSDNNPPAPNNVAQPGATTATSANKGTPSQPARLNRKSYPLAVLNGTTVTGLARGAADKLTARGYNEPNVVTNDTTNQQRATTEIYFEPKARAAALDVAKILGVKTASVKPMDANARALADRATVAVFVGADKAQ